MSATSFPSEITSTKLQNFSVGAMFLIISTVAVSAYYTIKDIEKDFHQQFNEMNKKIDQINKK
jgi:hypothetical protein